MILELTLLVTGFALVVKGADFLVEGASSLAKRLQIPEIVIGLTIVAFGTSAPELVVNTFASLAGKNEIVLGNIIGSNVFNTLLILGIAGLIYPLEVQRNSVRKEIPFSLLVVVIFFFIANDHLLSSTAANRVSRLDGLILLVFFAVFLYYTFGLTKIKTGGGEQIKLHSPLKTGIFIFLGFAGLFLGGKLVVDNAVSIAQYLKVSEKLIGLTIVSMGTSLPELATSAVAAYKKRSDLAVGNVLGSNIFNLLFILGISVEIAPLPYDTAFNFDLSILFLGTLLLFIAMFTLKSRKLDRWEALVLLSLYIVYLVWIISRK
jgi:cation:H+ antiporter